MSYSRRIMPGCTSNSQEQKAESIMDTASPKQDRNRSLCGESLFQLWHTDDCAGVGNVFLAHFVLVYNNQLQPECHSISGFLLVHPFTANLPSSSIIYNVSCYKVKFVLNCFHDHNADLHSHWS